MSRNLEEDKGHGISCNLLYSTMICWKFSSFSYPITIFFKWPLLFAFQTISGLSLYFVVSCWYLVQGMCSTTLIMFFSVLQKMGFCLFSFLVQVTFYAFYLLFNIFCLFSAAGTYGSDEKFNWQLSCCMFRTIVFEIFCLTCTGVAFLTPHPLGCSL